MLKFLFSFIKELKFILFIFLSKTKDLKSIKKTRVQKAILIYYLSPVTTLFLCLNRNIYIVASPRNSISNLKIAYNKQNIKAFVHTQLAYTHFICLRSQCDYRV